MAIKSIKKYSDKRFENLNQLLSKRIQKNSFDTFHQIRIEIKKLHAVSRFFEFSKIKFLNEETNTIIDLIFSDSGKIREIQVGLQLIKRAFPEIKNHECVGILKKRLEKYQADFAKKQRRYEEIDKNTIEKDIKMNKLLLTNYIGLLRESKDQIPKGPKELPSMIHKIRVNLKDAAYLSRWLPQEKPNEKELKFILELGEWHDLVSLRKLILKTLAKKEFNEVSTSHLVMAIQKINRSINNKLNQLNRVDERKKVLDKDIKKGQLN